MYQSINIIKLSYISGLRAIVLKELEANNFEVIDEAEDAIFIGFSEETILKVKRLRSVARAYIVAQDSKYHPDYISNHKSILGGLIETILRNDVFKTFKISCAGRGSQEVISIKKYIHDSYKLQEKDNADLKIHIIKFEDTWEIGIQITPRPLSVRDYRVINISGAMDPTIAYAVNSLCDLDKASSYLNIFSGSGTLLIEAGQCYPNLSQMIGFDNNKKHLSTSIKNIKKSGLIKRIQIREDDIFNHPDLGKFDVIVSDLPFGMSISKNEDLSLLYKSFIKYCDNTLNKGGKLVVYTSKYELFESIIKDTNFKIIETVALKFMTSVDAYLRPKILVCQFKN